MTLDIERTLHALLRIWHELPRLVGLQWADIYPELCDVLRRLAVCDDCLERDWLMVGLRDILEPHSMVLRRIDEVCLSRGPMRDDEPSPPHEAADPEWQRDLVPGILHRIDPPVTTRYTDVSSPRRLPLHQRGAIVVGLTLEASSYGGNSLPVTLRLDQLVEANLIEISPGVQVVGKRVKQLVLEENRDVEPVVFYVLGYALGMSLLRIDFRQNGQTIGTVPLRIEVCAESRETAEQAVVSSVGLETGGTYLPPADLEFRVLLHEDRGRTSFHYVLNSPTGAADLFYRSFSGKAFTGSAESYSRQLLRTLERYSGNRAADDSLGTEVVKRRLRSVGERIFEELLPEDLQEVLCQIQTGPVKTLQITSDEPWIPWELLQPETIDPVAAASWYERFALARWLVGKHAPRAEIRVWRLACIEAAGAVEEEPLQGAVEDRQYLSQVSAETGVIDLSLADATLDEVGELLDHGDIDLWHFSGHGSAESDAAEAEGIRLMRRTTLLPADLDWQRRRHIADRHPLVFLNMAGARYRNRTLTGLAGWVKVWIQGSRCGALLAPIYAVDDQLAHLFSRTFYEAARRGQTVGQAAMTARRAVQEKDPEGSDWMAYVVYAHPNARIVFKPEERLSHS